MVSNPSGKYVIIFGGWSWSKGVTTDEILICDMNKKDIIGSKLKCPRPSEYNAFITNDNMENDELLTFGYISRCYRERSFSQFQPLSNDLIHLIAKWICIQEIHLMERGTGYHWIMNIDDILRS